MKQDKLLNTNYMIIFDRHTCWIVMNFVGQCWTHVHAISQLGRCKSSFTAGLFWGLPHVVVQCLAEHLQPF